MDQVSQIIGERVRTIRSERKWTQSELADRAGLGLTTIGKLERGDHESKLATLMKTIDALEVEQIVFFIFHKSWGRFFCPYQYMLILGFV